MEKGCDFIKIVYLADRVPVKLACPGRGDKFPAAVRCFVPRLPGEAKNAGFGPKNLKKPQTKHQRIINKYLAWPEVAELAR